MFKIRLVVVACACSVAMVLYYLAATTNLHAERHVLATEKTVNHSKKICELDISNISAKISIDYDVLREKYDDLTAKYKQEIPDVEMSYQFVPSHCMPSRSIAIIIPIRNRTEHLRILLAHLHPILMQQLVRFQVYTITQAGHETFNKGRLANAGFAFAREISTEAGQPYDCYIFHDVDLLSENPKYVYRCGYDDDNIEQSRVYHLSHSINKYGYKLCCGVTLGGVVAFTEKQFLKLNGYSNKYWGWGGEDDDMYLRVINKKYAIERTHNSISRYTMIKHGKDELNPRNPKAAKLLKHATVRSAWDGLNNLDVEVLSVEVEPLYINVTIDVRQPGVLRRHNRHP